METLGRVAGNVWNWLLWNLTHLTLGGMLWIGLGALTIVLLVLMKTRWGQVAPIWKCAVLSVFAHILLGVYAWTTQLVFVAPLPPASETISLTVVEPDSDNQSKDDETTQLRPWDEFDLSSDASPERVEIERAETDLETELERTGPELAQDLAVPGYQAEPATEVAAPVEPSSTLLDDNPAQIEDTQTPVSPSDIASQRERREPPDVVEAPAADVASRPEITADPDELSMIRPPVHRAPEEGALQLDSERLQELAGNAPQTPKLMVPTRPDTDLDVPAVDRDRIAGTPASSTSKVAPRLVDGLPIPDLYAGRSPDERKRRATELGGSLRTESAVDAALIWLAANQEAEGNWNPVRHEGGKEHRVLGHDRQRAGIGADSGITGLALLAFLGAGHTHLQGQHRETVRRGLEFLVRQQGSDGDLAGNARLFARMYCHAMASLALSEALATTGDQRLREPVQRAVNYSLAAQHRVDGGWRYRPGDFGDMSQFGWQVMALRSAQLAGIEIGEDAQQRMTQFLQRCSTGQHGGLSGYQPGQPPTATMTAEALLCRYFLNIQMSPQTVTEASQFLLARTMPGEGEANFYYWYYASLALFHVGGNSWTTWNERLVPTLVNSQNGGGAQAGSWDPVCVWAGYGGRVYSTAMAALCLEVYYRYSSQPAAAKEPVADGQSAAERLR